MRKEYPPLRNFVQNMSEPQEPSQEFLMDMSYPLISKQWLKIMTIPVLITCVFQFLTMTHRKLMCKSFIIIDQLSSVQNLTTLHWLVGRIYLGTTPYYSPQAHHRLVEEVSEDEPHVFGRLKTAPCSQGKPLPVVDGLPSYISTSSHNLTRDQWICPSTEIHFQNLEFNKSWASRAK